MTRSKQAKQTKETPFLIALRSLAATFTTGPSKRTSDETITTLRDDAPSWMTCAVRAAHDALGGRLPGDWEYAACEGVADALVDLAPADADAARASAHDVADGLVDVYNSARSEWLADDLRNATLVDEACFGLGVSADADTFTRIGLGQYLAYERIASAIIDAVEVESDRRKEAFGERIQGIAAAIGGAS